MVSSGLSRPLERAGRTRSPEKERCTMRCKVFLSFAKCLFYFAFRLALSCDVCLIFFPTPDTQHPTPVSFLRAVTPGQCDRPVAERSDLVSIAHFCLFRTFRALSWPNLISANTRDGFPAPRPIHDAWWLWARRGRDILGGFPHPSPYAYQNNSRLYFFTPE